MIYTPDGRILLYTITYFLSRIKRLCLISHSLCPVTQRTYIITHIENRAVIWLQHKKKHVEWYMSGHWRHDERDSVSNHRHLDCLLNRLFRRRSKKTSKPRVTGPCEKNSPVTGDFPAQKDSNVEYVFILWRHHVLSREYGTLRQLLALYI